MTAHNQWLAPFCWTATVFSSRVSYTETDLVLIYESLNSGSRMPKDESRMNAEWMNSSLHGRLYSLAVGSLFVSAETFIESSLTRKRVLYWVVLRNPPPLLHGTCVNFIVTLWFPRLHLSFSYHGERLFNTQRWFMSTNRISAVTCLPVRLLETSTCHNILNSRPLFYQYIFIVIKCLTTIWNIGKVNLSLCITN
jgi:hypothetical protein